MTDLGDTAYDRITALMDRLRAECPWDREQSFETIAPYTVEESYEVMDAVERKNMPDLKNELGDLLFQVLFHSKMASEIGAFNFEDVCNGLVEKMVRRHPHVFAGGERSQSGRPQPRPRRNHRRSGRPTLLGCESCT